MPWHAETGRTMQGLTWLFLLEFIFNVMALQPGFLDFDNLPDTNFSCIGKVIGGYYADLETNCQMFHVCTIGQLDEPMDIRFLCLNGTVFDQETRVCERIDEVDCTKSEKFYSLNLELYGNTQPPIAEESPEVEFSIDLQKTSTSSTTSTTTTTKRPEYSRSTTPSYRISSTIPSSTIEFDSVITSHHFPIAETHDIHLDPEEINISLNSETSDIAKTQVPISYQQQSFDDDEKNPIVTTHTVSHKVDKPHRVSLLPTENPQSLEDDENLESPQISEDTQTPKSVVRYDLTHQHASPTEINYGFTNLQDSNRYPTGSPQQGYNYNGLQPPSFPIHPYAFQFHTTKRTPKFNFPSAPTYKPQTPERQIHNEQLNSPTKKTPRLQLSLPPFPTLGSLSFSSPAPFGFENHIETKRYTNDHHSPPRVIISASASVSDNSGRRLNYSLGTIGAGHILASPPTTYDEYKEEDVALDPFYHDVPKLKKPRRIRRATSTDDDEESDDILKYLFELYVKRKNQQEVSIPIRSEDITQINEQLAPVVFSNGTENHPHENDAHASIKTSNLRQFKNEKLSINENYPRGNLHHKLSNLRLSDSFNDRNAKNYRFGIGPSPRMDNVLDGSEVLRSVYAIVGSASLDNLSEERAEEQKPKVAKGRNIKNEDSSDLNQNSSVSVLSFESKQFSETILPHMEVTTENPTSLMNNTEEVSTRVPNVINGTSSNDSTILDKELQTTTAFYDYYEDVEFNATFVPNSDATKEQFYKSTTPTIEQDKITNTLVTERPTKTTEKFLSSEYPILPDYVDDNYEPLAYTLQTEQSLLTTTGSGKNELAPTSVLPKHDMTTVKSNESSSINTNAPETSFSTVFVGEPTFGEDVTSSLYTENLISYSSLSDNVTTNYVGVTSSTSVSDNDTTTEYDTSTSTEVLTVGTTKASSTSRPRVSGTTTSLYQRRDKTKPLENHRHRFNSLNRRKSTREKDKSESTTPEALRTSGTEKLPSSVSNINSATVTAKLSDSTGDSFNISANDVLSTTNDDALTDAPLSKSVIPTRTNPAQLDVSTTPLSKSLVVPLGKEVKKEKYTFNCFDKKIHQFFSDPRDCRLFHYCTLGYTKNQLVDMKFVCDLGTYFDEEKLVCSETKPSRCV